MVGHRDDRHGPNRSACECRQVDGGIIAHGSDRFQGHVAGRPFVVLLEQDRSHEAYDGVLVGRRLISPLSRWIGLVLCSSAGLSFVQEGGELGQLRAQLIGDSAPLSSCGLGVILGERGGDEGRDDAPAEPAGMRQHVAHEVDAGVVEKVPGG